MSPWRARIGGKSDHLERQPVEQIGAELALVDLAGRFSLVAATMRTSTEIGLDAPMRVISPYSTARSSRSWAGHRQGSELVEEQGAAVRLLEPPMAGLGGAGEAARLVAEQLGLDQIFGQGRAVHDDQRARPARRQMVKALGDQLLAGAALADDQHRPVERRGAARALDRVEERQALPDELIRPLHNPSFKI